MTIPLWVAILVVLTAVVGLYFFVAWRKSKNPASRGFGHWPFKSDEDERSR